MAEDTWICPKCGAENPKEPPFYCSLCNYVPKESEIFDYEGPPLVKKEGEEESYLEIEKKPPSEEMGFPLAKKPPQPSEESIEEPAEIPEYTRPEDLARRRLAEAEARRIKRQAVDWYHLTWVVVLAFFINTILGLVLLWTHPNWSRKLKIGVTALVLAPTILYVLCLVAFFTTGTLPFISAEKVYYDQLVASPLAYKDKLIEVTGEVTQIKKVETPYSNYTPVYVRAKKNIYETPTDSEPLKIYYITATQKTPPNLKEKDFVKITGYFKSIEKMDFGGETADVPSISATNIEKQE